MIILKAYVMFWLACFCISGIYLLDELKKQDRK
jgi:hypothetical protein